MLSSEEKSYLIGPEAKVLDAPELPVKRKLIRLRVNQQIYLHLNEGFAPLDKETLEFGDVTHLNNQGVFSSNAGSFIGTEGKILYRYDPETGEKTKVFDWMDVILRLNDLDESRAFENSAGEFFYATGRKIVKISQREVRQKQQLTLVSYVNVEDGTGRYDPKNGAGASAIMDAIIRFNNTDPEYNVKLKTVLYSTEAERNRLMVELATTDEYDLVDTCMLPEDAVKAGVMTDLLPYIDADEEISRDDFIEPLFSAMLKDGGLYEYTDKFTLLTLTAEKSLFPGRGNWTTEYIMESLAQRDDRDCLDRSRLMIDFVPAATAEFIDWDKMSCSFDSEAFKNWLVFLKGCPEGVETYEDPPLFYVCIDLAAELGMGAWTHGAPQDCVVAGFPETAGTGSYFVKLEGAEPVMRALTYGNYSRIAMPAAGKHQDGAWRFVRTLMLGDSEPAISAGIPVFKDSFEKGIEAALAGGKNLTGEMAEILRGQVYNTDKLVHYDEDLFRIINTEASAYFDGQKTVDEAAQQIQSRISIYLAEHSG